MIKNNPEEQWRKVKGLDNYYCNSYMISNLGRVKSVSRYIETKSGTQRLIEEKLLTPIVNKRGYLSVNLSKNNTSLNVFVHKLVAFAWLEECPGKYGCKKGCYNIDHIDSNKRNNSASNLQWLTVEDNTKKGVGKKENASGAKLTNDEVVAIRNSDLSYKELANIYKVSRRMIHNIISGESWKHLDYPNKKEQVAKRKTGLSKLNDTQIISIILDDRPKIQIAKAYKISAFTVSKIKDNPNKHFASSSTPGMKSPL